MFLIYLSFSKCYRNMNAKKFIPLGIFSSIQIYKKTFSGNFLDNIFHGEFRFSNHIM